MERQIDVSNMTIDEAYYEMKYCEENGEHVRCRKSGHEFHSINVTLDEMYETLTGMTKEQFHKENAKELYHARLEKERIDEKKPEWIAKGEKLIYIQNVSNWKECVDNLANNKYGGNPIEIALEIMEALEAGEKLAVVAKMINSDNKKLNILVENIVFRYSKKGPEFKEYMLGENITAEDMEEIEKVRKKNIEYKKEEREIIRFGY